MPCNIPRFFPRRCPYPTEVYAADDTDVLGSRFAFYFSSFLLFSIFFVFVGIGMTGAVTPELTDSSASSPHPCDERSKFNIHPAKASENISTTTKRSRHIPRPSFPINPFRARPPGVFPKYFPVIVRNVNSLNLRCP